MSLCNTIRFRTTKEVRALVESGADVNALDTGWLGVRVDDPAGHPFHFLTGHVLFSGPG